MSRIEAGAQIAAVLADRDPADEAAMITYGRNLGTAFQLVDDALDYDASPEELGKNLGDDLAEGKPTLPLIYTLAEGTADEQALVRDAISNKTAENIDQVLAAVTRCGALDYTRKQARHYHDLALVQLERLGDTPARSALAQITARSINRDH